MQIEQEQLGYIGKSGNTLTALQRGVNGTARAQHAANAVVTYIPATGPVSCRIVAQGGGCSLAPQDGRGNVPFLLLCAGLAVRMLRRRRG